MRRILLLATLIALIAVPQSFAAAGWIKSVSAAQKSAKEKSQVIFVDLFAQWCGWCHRFEGDVYPSEAFQKATSNMVLLRLDIEDGGEGSAFAKRFQVSTLPTFLLLNPDFTIVGQIRGYAPPAEFVRMMGDTLNKYKSFQKLVDSEDSFATDYPKRLELAKEFRYRQNYSAAEPRLRKLIGEKSVPVGLRDQAYYELGINYLMEGKYKDVKKTIDDFNKVQTQGEPYERAQLLATDVCLAQGNLRCAADELRNFKQKFPNSPLIPNVDMMLPSIERQLGPVKQQ
ncbi:MAG TPA: thioredoxin family protein [Thermoanaerobaculia bacterium]|nr:thioredoxin family protein [Thermoanaerobaculia bacterium]